MRKRTVILMLASVLSIGLVVPAVAAPSLGSLAKRVKKLEKRVNGLALLLIEQEVQTESFSAFALHQGGGYYSGEASCLRGKATGGGVRFGSGGLRDDHVIDSYPTASGRGWRVFASAPSGASVTVYVVCSYVI